MKKILLIALLSCGVALSSSAIETVYSHDFNDLEGFTTYDIDQEEPCGMGEQLGLGIGTAWTIYDGAAISNSTNKHGMAAVEDWLITPAITLTEGNIITFETYTQTYGSQQKVATYKVLLSTTGVAVEDFTVELATKESATSTSTYKGYDLSAYAGQTVHIAIVNVSRSKDALFIDNMFVGVPDLFTYDVTYNSVQNDPKAQQNLTVKLTSSLKEVFTTVTATLTGEGLSDTYINDAVNLKLGGELTFSFDKPLPVPAAGKASSFELTITAANENTTLTETYVGSIAMQGYQPFKRVLCEEYTGTWCGWCPRGHYYMEKMDHDYPETYIGIATHAGDVMTHEAYDKYFSKYAPGAPSGRVDRDNATAGCDPSDFPRLYSKYINQPAVADINVAVEWVDDSKQELRITSYTAFAFSAENFVAPHLEYVVVEDNINRPGEPSYNQNNYYSGGGSGALGGYENLPDPVLAEDMFYHDVVRHVITGEAVGKGIANCFPKDVKMKELYSHSVTMEVPDNIFEIENCEFIVLLIDPATGIVYNSAKNTLAGSVAVKDIEADRNVNRIYRSLNGVAVDVATAGEVEINVYALDGRLVSKTAPRYVNANFTVECLVAGTGVYLVNVVCNGVSSTHKVIL